MKNLLRLLLFSVLLYSCNNEPTPVPIDSTARSTTDTTAVFEKVAYGKSSNTNDSTKNKKTKAKKVGATSSVITLGNGSGSISYDGSGQTLTQINIAAGTYSGITLANVNGTPTTPVVVINSGGQVKSNAGSDAGLDLSTCRYVHVTGTGAANVQYGFLLVGGGTGDFDAHYGSSDIEIDHIECGAGTNYAGLIFRTYPSEGCQWSVTGGNGPATQAQMNAPKWAIYNMIIHDNYIHDVSGEGMYLGCSHYGNVSANAYDPVNNPLVGIGYACAGGNESPIIGMKVYNNKVSNVGYDGIQVSGCISGCSVTNNQITGFATANQDGQDGGITWNPGSVGTVDRNSITYTGSGVCMGIMYQGQGDTYFTNNIINGGGSGQVGIAFLRNTQPNVQGSTHSNIYFANNTVTGFGTGYWWYGDNGFASNCHFTNNIVTTAYSIGNGNISTLQKQSNLEVTPPKFVSSTDFHLAAGSPAIGTGTAVSYVTTDYAGSARVSPYDIGAYAYNGTTPPPTVTIAVTAVSTPPSITLPTSTVSLTGTATRTPAGSITTYKWTATGGTITTPNAQNTTITGLAAGSYTFTLTASDGQGNSGVGKVSVTVNPAGGTNTPPTVVTLGDQTLPIGASTCNISCTPKAGSAAITKFQWTQVSGPGTAVFSAPTQQTSGVSGLVNGAYKFQVTVTDANNLSASASEIVTVSGVVVTVKTIVALSYTNNTANSITVKYSDGTQATKTIKGITWTTTAGSGIMTFTDGTSLKLN